MGVRPQNVVVLDKASKVPLYQQLADELEGAIRAGIYAPGAKIPSEHELAEAHGVGRPTVRQATDALIDRGLLVRRRGSGTFVRVAPAAIDLFSLGGTLVSFEARGVALRTELLERPTVVLVDDPAHPLVGRRAVRVERLSRAEGEAVLLEEIDLDAERFPKLATLPLAGRSLSDVIATHYRLRAVAADQSFQVERLDARRAGHLGKRPGTSVLRVDRTLHFTGAASAVFARMLCPNGRFVFSQRIGGQHA